MPRGTATRSHPVWQTSVLSGDTAPRPPWLENPAGHIQVLQTKASLHPPPRSAQTTRDCSWPITRGKRAMQGHSPNTEDLPLALDAPPPHLPRARNSLSPTSPRPGLSISVGVCSSSFLVSLF